MILFFSASAVIGAVVILVYIIRALRPFQTIPADKFRFYNILGDLKNVDLKKDLGVQILDLLVKKKKTFPNEPLICAWLSYIPFPIAMKSDAAREILKETKLLDKSTYYQWVEHLLRKGLLTSGGAKWKSRRRLFNPCFHSEILRNYLETFNKKSQKLVKVLQKEAQKDYCDILEHTTLCALDTVCETIFGSTVHVLEDDKLKASNTLKKLSSIVMTRLYLFWTWPDFIFWNSKTGRNAKKHLVIFEEFCQKLIDDKKKSFLNGDRTIYNGKHKPIIDVLLEKHLETHEFSEEDVLEEVLTFMTTGHDTIGLAIMWALYVIGQHPEVQARLHEEVDRVFGEDRERPTTEADLKDLYYMDCVLKECYRLYPTAPIIARTVSEETKICGFTMPKGTSCTILIYCLHRDEDVFPDPEKFDPNRFSYENRAKIPEFAFIPFSGGPRGCIGHKFAEMEVGTMMSWILRNLAVETLNKVLPLPGLSLHPSEPVRIKIRSRDHNKT